MNNVNLQVRVLKPINDALTPCKTLVILKLKFNYRTKKGRAL